MRNHQMYLPRLKVDGLINVQSQLNQGMFCEWRVLFRFELQKENSEKNGESKSGQFFSLGDVLTQ